MVNSVYSGLPVILIITIILSLWGCGLFLLLPEYLASPKKEDSVEPEEGQYGPTGVLRIPPYIFVLLTVCNILISCVLYLYYRKGMDDIFLTVAAASFLWSCAYVDLKEHLIPNKILLISLLVRIAWFFVEMILLDTQVMFIILSSLIAAAALMIASFLCRVLVPKSVGMGDIKIMGVLGLYLGMDKVWGALFTGFLILFVVCVYLLITKKAGRKSEVAFAPFLLIGTILGALAVGI